MIPDPDRFTAAASALAGAAFWGLFSLATILLAGQRPTWAVGARAAANVLVGVVGGVLAAWFLGPAIAPLIPIASLRDLHAVGFGIGAVAWEVAPFAYRMIKARAAKVEGGQG